jgi:hypothetical protein
MLLKHLVQRIAFTRDEVPRRTIRTSHPVVNLPGLATMAPRNFEEGLRKFRHEADDAIRSRYLELNWADAIHACRAMRVPAPFRRLSPATRFVERHRSTTPRGGCRYSSPMNNLPVLGAFVCLIGLFVLVVNTVGDTGTPTVSHVDVLGLAMSVSGAILARGSRA